MVFSPLSIVTLLSVLSLSLLSAQEQEEQEKISQQEEEVFLEEEPIQQENEENPAPPFEAFTGQVTGTKVRLRLHPTLESVVLGELPQEELLVIIGEEDEFYKVKPDPKWKGYIYRAYILDNVVEANNVNLRLAPNTEAIIVTQLQQGRKVKGTICSENNKWMAIDLPESVCFYIAKEYVENIGNASLYTTIQTRQSELSRQLDTLETSIKKELQKPFHEIQLVPLVSELKVIVAKNSDLPEQVHRAEHLIAFAQEEYLTQSQKAHATTIGLAETAESDPPNNDTAQQEHSIQQRIVSPHLEEQESHIVAKAIQLGQVDSEDLFYQNENRVALEFVGQLIPYERVVKNRPGDFILVDDKTKVPLAYLYSTRINLRDHIGSTIRIFVSPRPNHHFALPAYYVLELKS